MSDDNFDKLWATFKRSLVEARENRKDGEGSIYPWSGRVSISSGEDGAAIFIARKNESTYVDTSPQHLYDIAAHCLLAAEEMKPETNYNPTALLTPKTTDPK